MSIEIDQNEETMKAKADIFATAEKVAVVDEANVEQRGMKAEVVAKEEVAVTEELKSKKNNKVVWQFKNRRYVFITNIIDKMAEHLPSGRKVMRTIKARNFRLPLDLDDADDLALHNELLKSNQCGNEFMLLKEAAKNKTNLPERAETLTKLWDMDYDQLQGMLDVAEMEEAGIIPGSNPTKTELILAIIDIKKLSGGNI